MGIPSILKIIMQIFIFCLCVLLSHVSTVRGRTHYHVPEELRENIAEFEMFVKKTISCRKVPSVAISMVKDNKVIFAQGFGHSDLETGKKAKDKTRFCIGSLTKGFTTALLANILSKEKNLTWDTPIRDILGDNFRLSDDMRTQNVNLRDLLAHKVGTPAYFHALLVGFPENTTREDIVRRLRFMPATENFRTKFQYSNYMYTLAGHVAEVLAGKSWETMVMNDLIEPLGMRDTGFIDQFGSLDGLATPYALTNGNLLPVKKDLVYAVLPSGPAGSIYSTAGDMAKWMLFHLSGGHSATGEQLVDGQWLSKTYSPQMTQPFSEKDILKPFYPAEDVAISYNMGWLSSVYRGYRKVWHSGGIVTFTSHLWLFPDKNAGVFVIINGPLSSDGSTAVKTIALRAADLLLGEEPWLNVSNTCTYPSPWIPQNEKERPQFHYTPYNWNISRSMQDYTGVFGDFGFGNITVEIINQTYLTLYFGRFGEMHLQPMTLTSFWGKYVGNLWFITDSDYSHAPIEMNYKVSVSGTIEGLYFPVDFTAGKTFFKKNLSFNDLPKNYAAMTHSTCSASVAMDTTHYLILLVSMVILCLNL